MLDPQGREMVMAQIGDLNRQEYHHSITHMRQEAAMAGRVYCPR